MTQTGQQRNADLDRIERSIDIDAPADKVFGLVSRPGWWINDGNVDPDQEVTYEGDVAVVVHDQYGKFRIQPLESDPPRYVSYKWLDRDDPAVGTTTEFWVADREGGGVTLRVVESGFTQLGNEHEKVVKHVQENTEGWEAELVAAERFVTGG